MMASFNCCAHTVLPRLALLYWVVLGLTEAGAVPAWAAEERNAPKIAKEAATGLTVPQIIRFKKLKIRLADS
ncbi:hypothetical protein [Salaquimonas pukyongi]|uniref:hypothetical protein n=1 Tax=Salaquimonas pukyongi TaxID=2712698 RepID=UPI0013BEA981|nr:hypothetical protein [Salaquimonas pukyongi]